METNIFVIHAVLLILASLSNAKAQTVGSQVSKVEIGRGVCGSYQLSPYPIMYALTGATPTMVLEIQVLRQISSVQCTKGVNFGIAPGNSYLWTSSGCVAEFSILSVVTTTSTSTTTTTTATTTSTSSSGNVTNNDVSCGETGAGLGFRIIGGADAGDCQYPWMVLVYNQVSQSMCGGSIIDNSYILTAAHCFNPQQGSKVKANELIIFSGSASIDKLNASKKRFVSQIITHEKYNNATLEYDIAILKLKVPIVYNVCHKPLCLTDGTKTPQEATGCRAMGWGLTSNAAGAQVQPQMQSVELPIASDDACRGVYGQLSNEKTFCAGTKGKDTCQGDSGGPLACKEANGKYYMNGIVSAGMQGNCGNTLGLYTRVSAYLNWITANTQ